EGENCEGCDFCLAPKKEKEDFDATIISQKILSAIVRTGEAFGARHVIDVLRGSKSQKVLEKQHDLLSVYGIEKEYKPDDMRDIIYLLEEHFYLKREGEKYPVLKMTQKGLEALKKRDSIRLPLPKKDLEIRSSSSRIQNYDRTLYEELRILRKKIADEKNLPPFVIFSNASLIEMSARLPQSFEGFSRITGVGERKLRDFGSVFVPFIRNYAREHNLQDTMTEKPTEKKTQKLSGNTYLETKSLIERKLSINEIALERGLSADTITCHIEKLAQSEYQCDIEYLRPAEEDIRKIKAAFNGSDDDRLKPAYDKLAGSYSYAEIRLARLFIVMAF
ncbi:MAG: RQC domain-containing protein, partial [Spirochaetota bacterium]|nr:RQC domain-containing protein [Spirochaetota bacterium]